MEKDKLRVVVGMSGGVDSSIAAYLLKQQGYDVIGLFMKNWEESDDNGCCTAERDFSDVKRVCEVIGIPYYSVNFSKEYMDNVFKGFLDGLKRGITPNPDILCNREIKFGPFLDFADKIGADFIATGHYCRVENSTVEAKFAQRRPLEGASIGVDDPSGVVLLKGVDISKDQSYFLCALTQKQLSRVIFPLGNMHKTEVRKLARELGFVTSDKKGSTGICFIGERNFHNFMSTYLGNQPGLIKTLDGKTVGEHTGLMYYTIGQRKGMGIGASGDNSARWFVVKKDLASNTLYVNNGDCPELYSKSLVSNNFNWIKGHPDASPLNGASLYTAKVRYRQPDQECTVEVLAGAGAPRRSGCVRVTFKKPQRAVTTGQWVVLYDGDVCLGGGEINCVE